MDTLVETSNIIPTFHSVVTGQIYSRPTDLDGHSGCAGRLVRSHSPRELASESTRQVAVLPVLLI
jgi:hypothetical protein